MAISVSENLSQGKHVEGNQEGAAKVKKVRTWRQYMNRFVALWIPWTSHLPHEHPPAVVDLIGRSLTYLPRPYPTLILSSQAAGQDQVGRHRWRSTGLSFLSQLSTSVLLCLSHVTRILSSVFWFSGVHISHESKCLTAAHRVHRTIHIIRNY